MVCSACHKFFWVCWGNSVLRSERHYTAKVIVFLVAAYILLYLSKCFYTLLVLLVHFCQCLLWWPNYHGSYHNPTNALCSATCFLLKCIQLLLLLYFLYFTILGLHFLLLFWTSWFLVLQLASVGIMVLCWWPKVIAPPVTEAKVSAARHRR